MERFHDRSKISEFSLICLETIQPWLGGKSYLSYINFRRPFQSIP